MPKYPQLSRRNFIKTSAATIASSMLLPSLLDAKMSNPGKITRIDIYSARYPMTGYFKFFSSPSGSTGRSCVTVKLTTDQGLVGWGQSVPIAKWSYETLETATTTLKDYFAPALIGHDAADIAGAHAKMDQAIAPSFSVGMPITRAGVDIALWDLAGKAAGKSVTELMGRKQIDPLTLSWTLNARTLEEVPQLVEQGRARGYENFNIKVAPDPEFDVKLAKAARKAAPEGFLWADANCGFEPEIALQAASRLADAGVDIFEAPIRPNQIRGYQALKKQGALPILMDEGVISPRDLEEFIALDMLDGIASKPSRCGGLTSNLAQIELILKHNLQWVGSGLTDPDISLAATLHLYNAYQLKKPAALNGLQFLTASILMEPFADTDGKLICPEGPGLGVDVDEDKLVTLVNESSGRVCTVI